VNVGALDWALTTGLEPGARFVLVVLAIHANGELTAWPSAGLLARETGYHPSSVRRILDDLEDRGLIDLERRRGRSAVVVIHNPAPQARTSVDNPAPEARTHPAPDARHPAPDARKPRASGATEVLKKYAGSTAAPDSVYPQEAVTVDEQTFLPGTGWPTGPDDCALCGGTGWVQNTPATGEPETYRPCARGCRGTAL